MKIKKPIVSIITVCYNAEKFLEKTIVSVINQTYKHIEYIIIDGNSSDSTLNIIKKYQKDINYWISELDKSLYEAMNKGLKKAKGDYILFMNAGDCFHKNSSLELALKDSNNADLIYALAQVINNEGNRYAWHKETPLPYQLKAKSFILGMVVCHQCMIVKRKLAPYYSLHWQVSSDIDWVINVMKKVKTKHFFNDIFCNYLEGGIAHQQRVLAVTERFFISKKHFGLLAALLAQFKIIWLIIRRKLYKINS